MNIIHTVKSLATLPRILASPLEKALRWSPAVIVTGARQTGKTTLVTTPSVAAGRTFVSLDEIEAQDEARREPARFLGRGARLTIDEVQRAPDLLLAIKREVDRERRPGRFLLTGSANLLMMREVSESLAGRATYLDLWPLTEAEKRGRPDPGPWSGLLAARSAAEAREILGGGEPCPDWADRILAGGFPRAALAADPQERSGWFSGYVRTYLERDLRDLSQVASLADFQRLMQLAAHRVGQIVNQSDLARDAGLAQATAHRYLNLLETSFQIVRVSPYAVSRTKRLVKMPKLYWTDPGLAAHLARVTNPAALRREPRAGAFLENLVLTSLQAWRETVTPRPEILFWRTHPGEEVDFLIEAGSRLLPIEIKASGRVRLSDAESLRAFLGEYAGRAPFGLLLHTGAEDSILFDRVVAAPICAALRAGPGL